LLSPEAKESPMATTNTSSTVTFGSANWVPFGSCTLTDTPDTARLSENGTRLITSLSLQACLRVSGAAPGRRACHVHTQSPGPAAARCSGATCMTTVWASGRM